MTDDPKNIAIELLHLLVLLFFVSLPATIPLTIVLAVWNWRKLLRDWRYSVRVGAFAVGLLALWMLINYDPGHVWYWFFD